MRDDGRMAEHQLSELRNMRVLLEEHARLLARGLAYHRRAALKTVLGRALEEVDGQLEDLPAGSAGDREGRTGVCGPKVRVVGRSSLSHFPRA